MKLIHTGRHLIGLFPSERFKTTEEPYYWVDFKIWEAHSWEGDTVLTWGDAIDGWAEDPLDAVPWCEGFIKWDGCMEFRSDLHTCGRQMFVDALNALSLVSKESALHYDVPRED